MSSAPDLADLTLCNGCLCALSALYLKAPECVGCSSQSFCLCCAQEQCCLPDKIKEGIGFGMLDSSSHDANGGDFICKVGLHCCTWECTKPVAFVKSTGHTCCVVGNCQLPTDDKIPMVCALCTVMCYPSVKQGVKVSEIGSGGTPPTSLEMTR
uniref:Uncharacterized protein n=1 Tax=Octactis speculum TaxID=3111310 RepID=A0A7S2DUL6_9STRA